MPTIDLNNLSSEIQSKYSVASNAFSLAKIKNAELDKIGEPKDKIDVVIGDDKQPDTFYPQVKLCRWNNEVNVSVRLKNDGKSTETVTTDNDKIIWQKGDVKAEYFELPQDNINPEGAYEFNVILDKKPASNVLEFTIETKELDFFYQPELTEEEIEQGASRPENVIGSYAVYHKTKGGMNDSAGKEYKCGKAFHIYRPEVSDSKGNKVWGELNVDVQNKLLTVTIPQKFLDEAVYPVIIDPTFGYVTLGESKIQVAISYGDQSGRIGRVSSLSANGTLDSLHVGLSVSSGTETVDVTAFANIKDDPKSGSHKEIAHKEIIDLSVNGTIGWYKFTCNNEILSVDDYVLNVSGDEADLTVFTNLYIAYDSGTSETEYYDISSATTYAQKCAENPWTQSSSTQNRNSSIYATYTAAGSESSSESSSASSSPSSSPSSSQSSSPSSSESSSESASPSSSPSPGYQNYTKGDYAELPADDTDLETDYVEQDYTDVASKNDIRVDQTGTQQYMIHQFKDYCEDNNSCTLEWEGQSTLAPTSSTIYLQIYNRTTEEWDTVDSDNTTGADTDFTLTANVADLTNYKDGNTLISCRVYQLAL